jgi:hypothetical protein
MATNQELYYDAKARGDALGMRNANDAENRKRNAMGLPAQYANEDIANVARQQAAREAAADKASSRSVPVSQSYNLNDQIDQMYNAYRKQQLDALTAKESEIAPAYANVRNQAAVTQAQNQAGFNEYAAARGLNSGAGGQAYLARQNVYGNALNAADVAEQGAYRNIALQKSQVESDIERQRAQALYNEMVRSQQADAEQTRYNTNLALDEQRYSSEVGRDEQRYQQGLSQQAQETEYDRLMRSADVLASIGDFSGYQSLYGWTPEQVAAAESLYKQQTAPKVTASGGTVKTSKPTLTYAQMMSALEEGLTTPAVLAAYEYYMGTPLEGAADEQAPVENPMGMAADNTLDWVYIPGYGRVGATELLSLVNSGKVVESYNSETGQYRYTLAR